MRVRLAFVVILGLVAGLAAGLTGCKGDATGKPLIDKETGVDVSKPLLGPSPDDAPSPEGDGSE